MKNLSKLAALAVATALFTFVPLSISTAQASGSSGNPDPGKGWNTTNRAFNIFLTHHYPAPFWEGGRPIPGGPAAGLGKCTAGKIRCS